MQKKYFHDDDAIDDITGGLKSALYIPLYMK